MAHYFIFVIYNFLELTIIYLRVGKKIGLYPSLKSFFFLSTKHQEPYNSDNRTLVTLESDYKLCCECGISIPWASKGQMFYFLQS